MFNPSNPFLIDDGSKENDTTQVQHNRSAVTFHAIL